MKANNNQAKSLAQLIKSDTYPDIRHGIKLLNRFIEGKYTDEYFKVL